MSFSSEVKEELSRQTDSARHCRIAFLTALFHMAPVLTEDTVGIRTDLEYAAQAFANVLKKVVQAPVSEERRPKGKSWEITVTVSGKEQVKSLLEAMKLDRSPDTELIPQQDEIRSILPSRLLLQKTCCRRAYLRGVFLMTGSVSDPSKSYHLEIVFQRQEDARMIVKLMDSLGFGARVSTRKGRFVVYLKESEQISDLLGAMGATLCLMKLENERILKDIAGNINRQVNSLRNDREKILNLSRGLSAWEHFLPRCSRRRVYAWRCLTQVCRNCQKRRSHTWERAGSITA